MNETSRKRDRADASDSERTDDYPGLGTPPDAASGDGAQPQEGQASDWSNMSVADQIARLKRERDEFRDQSLRSRAEFANYQKRAKQQAETDRIYAVEKLARDLLDPIDNLDRAIEALRASGATDVTAGLDMVQKQLVEILAKHGVEPIAAHGYPFDPNLHDAVLQQPSLDHAEGTVVAELTKGYKIRDRVLRHSKVAVSAKPPE
jgi:molecular chaperone GrpE